MAINFEMTNRHFLNYIGIKIKKNIIYIAYTYLSGAIYEGDQLGVVWSEFFR